MKYALYYSQYCYFCQKVLMFLRGKEISEQIELRNTSQAQFAQELALGGGKTQVPCLRIETERGDVQWMYESDEIMRYLKQF